jgi:hypothetical protein
VLALGPSACPKNARDLTLYKFLVQFLPLIPNLVFL